MIEGKDTLGGTPARETALACVEAGLEAADPERIVGETLSLDGSVLSVLDTEYDLDAFEEVVVLGGGNAAGRMAAAVEELLGDRIDRGAVVTDAPGETERIDQLPGDHPVPSERGVESARTVLEMAESADESSVVLVAITGGGSALMPAPAGDVSLADLQSVTEALLGSGATIDEINAVRKHCSSIKGGHLARKAAPGRVIGLLLSDVVGNDLSVIASGPTVPDETTYDEARSLLSRYGIDPPGTVRTRLEAGTAGEREETPDAEDPAFERVENHVLADGFTPLAAATEVAKGRGYGSLILSSRIRGEAREAAKTNAAIAEEMRATGNPLSVPGVVVSGGETTVTLRGEGTGGPNQEFALSAAIECAGMGDVALAAVDTDGIDGPTEFAGALVTGETVEDLGVARGALAENDVAPYLEEREALVLTGPTGTNLNDLRVLVVE
ncbi:glycerate kinase type-2 family protein [Natronorarus salvus]|uniref:glycerate kinase type-2 family protein n=1 Tax=Natronorarus salvus TaxID=3117733 RepID=UPI002F2654B5